MFFLLFAGSDTDNPHHNNNYTFSRSDIVLPWYLDVLQRNLLFNFITRPDFIAYRHRDVSLGLRLCRRVWQVPLFYWTVTDKETLSAARDNGIACIFEGFDPTK